IQTMEQKTWQDFEQNKRPWPSPFLQQAWIGLMFFEKKSPENDNTADDLQNLNHTVWFLKFPLDEQAQLSLLARDDFLRRLIETLGNYLQQQKDNSSTDKVMYSLENAMKDNPYGFQPKQETLANFHAIVHQQLGLKSSSYYHPTQHYLAAVANSGNNSTNNNDWQQLGIQGFADLSARLDEKYQGKNNQKLVLDSIAQLPLPVLRVLGLCLENHKTSKQLLEAVLDMLINQIEHNHHTTDLASIGTAAIRMTAQSNDTKTQLKLLQIILSSAIKTDIEVLASISGRCWILLTHDDILLPYLEALALTDQDQHPGAFNAVLTDLMFIPGIRESILKSFRCSERSEILTQSIAGFLNQQVFKENITP
ncbi:MAG: DUF3549 family protein, partial [Thiotrichaceae bacterium]|nr:DUF3549 family protein [Thiotrichaceae bacterium]